jgi:hypothetical protein
VSGCKAFAEEQVVVDDETVVRIEVDDIRLAAVAGDDRERGMAEEAE